VETRAIASLAADGFDTAGIARLYPYLTAQQIDQAVDLERQLADNLSKQAA
jgi:uncharacterized protein (DUF433 family)